MSFVTAARHHHRRGAAVVLALALVVGACSSGDDEGDPAAALQNFSIEGDALADLELKIEEAGEGNEQQGVEQWVSENQDTVDEWLNV